MYGVFLHAAGFQRERYLAKYEFVRSAFQLALLIWNSRGWLGSHPPWEFSKSGGEFQSSGSESVEMRSGQTRWPVRQWQLGDFSIISHNMPLLMSTLHPQNSTLYPLMSSIHPLNSILCLLISTLLSLISTHHSLSSILHLIPSSINCKKRCNCKKGLCFCDWLFIYFSIL